MATEEGPHKKRRGSLINGATPGDFTKAARCGAKNRAGNPCQCPAMKNGRCRLHGGLSTGPRTLEGLEKCRMANWKTGEYSADRMEQQRIFRVLLRECQETLKQVSEI